MNFLGIVLLRGLKQVATMDRAKVQFRFRQFACPGGSSNPGQAHLGRWVVLGDGVTVGPNAEIDDSVLHAGASVGPGARVVGSILGPNTAIGARAVVTGSVLAEGARVEDDAVFADEGVSAGQPAGGSGLTEHPLRPA